MIFLTRSVLILLALFVVPINGMHNSRFSQPSPFSPSITPRSASLTLSLVSPAKHTSSSISADMALMNMRGYQQIFQSSRSHNIAISPQDTLAARITELAQQPKAIEIFNGRQKAITTEFNQVIQTLRTAVQTPMNQNFNSSQGIAKITQSWLNLSQLKLSNSTLNARLQDLVQSIQQATVDATGTFDPLQIYISEQEKTITKAINKFEASLQSWREDSTNIKLQALLDTQSFLQKYGSSGIYNIQAENPESWRFLTNAQTNKPLLGSATHNHLSQMAELCKNANLSQARELALKHLGDGNFFAFQAIHETHFAQKYTQEGIDLRFINDPFYLAKKHELVKPYHNNLLSLPHPFNEQLAQRYAHYEHIAQASNIKNPTPQMQQLIYQVIAKEMSNPHAAISASKTLIGLTSHQVHNTSQQASVAIGMNYLQKGLSTEKSAEASLKFAHEIQHALHNPQADQRILQLSDYTQTLKEPRHATMQEGIVSFIASKFDSKDWGAITKVDRAYREMKAGDIKAEFYLRQTFKTRINEQVLAQSHDAPMAYFAGVKESAVVAHVQESKDTTRVLIKGGSEITLQRYEMPHSVVQFLVKNGLDPQKYASCKGSIAQQINHADILKQVAKQHDLSGLQLIESSNLHHLLRLSTQVTDLSREYNSAANIMQSSVLSHFCWQMVGYVENAAKFGFDTSCSFGQGTYKGLSNFAHTATHPQELLYNFRDLVFGMAKVMHANAVLEEKLSIFKTPEQNEQIIREHAKQFEPIFQAIQERAANATFQDFVREGTALTVENFLTIRTLTTIGKIANVTKLHGEQLAHRITQRAKFREVIARTVEGLEVGAAPAAQASESGALRELSKKNHNLNIANSSDSLKLASLKQSASYQLAEATIIKKSKDFERLGLKPVSKSGLKHIINNHSIDGIKAQLSTKSVFYTNENIIELALEGLENGNWIDKNTKIYDCKRFIGLDLNGNPTTKIKVALNETMDSLRTIFPC